MDNCARTPTACAATHTATNGDARAALRISRGWRMVATADSRRNCLRATYNVCRDNPLARAYCATITPLLRRAATCSCQRSTFALVIASLLRRQNRRAYDDDPQRARMGFIERLPRMQQPASKLSRQRQGQEDLEQRPCQQVSAESHRRSYSCHSVSGIQQHLHVRTRERPASYRTARSNP